MLLGMHSECCTPKVQHCIPNRKTSLLVSGVVLCCIRSVLLAQCSRRSDVKVVQSGSKGTVVAPCCSFFRMTFLLRRELQGQKVQLRRVIVSSIDCDVRLSSTGYGPGTARPTSGCPANEEQCPVSPPQPTSVDSALAD